MAIARSAAKQKDRRFINQLEPGETLEDAVFMVSQKDLRTTTNGSLYVHMVFSDRTGQVVARIWQASQAQFDAIEAGGFLGIRGRVESYKGNLQVIVDALRPVKPTEIDVSNFLPHTRHDVEKMWERVLEVLRTVENADLRAVIKQFVNDEAIVAAFKKAPAAVQNHHAYIGGLLEHTLSLLELATRIFGEKNAANSHYPEVSRDLILAGLFLHDIGKIAELAYETNFIYTTEGQLVGHITQAALWIDRKIADMERESGKKFPEELRNVLLHIILSHHGSYEFGSPKLPACPEAIAIHYLDNIDAKLHMALNEIANAKDEDSDWTQFHRALETRVYKKDIMGCRTTRNA